MALTNIFRPSALSFNAYGWKGSPLYNRADVPTHWVQGASETDRVVIEQQLAYEWLDSGPITGEGGAGYVSTNPPFLSGAAGRLMPGLQAPNGGGPPRILRGFIRRAESDLSDPAAMARLYFMFNPENITRDYVSYLDQGALDPFNTVFQSGNLVAPPSYMDFTFSLLFDRQEEAASPDHPGVFVDYQYFDLVVRNVIPTSDPNAMNAALPDNGVMMVNPRDITVIFSPQITIQGRPSNARISFTKFTHRMVPVRMEIQLTMRVVYFGPMRDMTAYVKDEAITASTVPGVEAFTDAFNVTPDDMSRYLSELQESVAVYANKVSDAAGAPPVVPVPDSPDYSPPSFPEGTSQADTNMMLKCIEENKAIMARTKAKVAAANGGKGTTYSKNVSLWSTADCSGLVYGAFKEEQKLPNMGWTGIGASAKGMWTAARAHLKASGGKIEGLGVLFEVDGSKPLEERINLVRGNLGLLTSGDLLFRVDAAERDEDHVAWFSHWSTGDVLGDAYLFHASHSPKENDTGVGTYKTSTNSLCAYTSAIRPLTSS